MNDLAFKYVFGAEEHAPRLKVFLNAVLHYEGDDRIQKIGIKNPFIMGKTETEKTVILDVKAIDGRDRHYTIEVQIKPEPFFVNRVVCYGARVLAAQLEKGELYHLVTKVISLSILDHALCTEEDEVQAIYRLRHANTGRELADVIEFHFIELPRYDDREPPRDAPPCKKWINLIKYSRDYVKPGAFIPEALRNEEEIMMALESFKKMTADEEMRILLEERKKSPGSCS